MTARTRPRTWRAGVSSPSQAGFTLVEAMVALVVLSLVTLGLAGAMRALGEVQARISQRQARIHTIETTSAVLRQVLGEPVRENFVPAREAPGWPRRRIRFALAEHGLEWVGIMPARPGMGGATEFRLALEPDPWRPGTRNLVLRHRPRADVTQGIKFQPWESASAEILVSDVRELQIQVRSSRPAGWSINDPWDEAWRADWPETVRDLPQTVRLDVADAFGPWPPLIIGLRPTPPSAAGLLRAVIGGSEGD